MLHMTKDRTGLYVNGGALQAIVISNDKKNSQCVHKEKLLVEVSDLQSW